MTDEQGFLDTLQANPADDTTRLVYADWLDDRGESAKAEYLRLVVETAAIGPRVEPGSRAVRLLTATAEGIPLDWRNRAGGRFDLILEAFDPAQKILVVHAARELIGVGIAEAKGLCEALPWQVFSGIPFETAEQFCACFTTIATTARLVIQPNSGTGPTLNTPIPPAFHIEAGYGILPSRRYPGVEQAAVDGFTAFVAEVQGITTEEARERSSALPLVIEQRLPSEKLALRMAELRATAERHDSGQAWWIRLSLKALRQPPE